MECLAFSLSKTDPSFLLLVSPSSVVKWCIPFSRHKQFLASVRLLLKSLQINLEAIC